MPAEPWHSLERMLGSVQTLHSLLYTSELAPGQDPACIAEITTVSRFNNTRDGITGILVFDGTHFAQWLEGPLDILERLLGRLRRDPRHGRMRIQHHAPLPEGRLFSGWRLGYVSRSNEDHEISRLRGLHGDRAVQAFRGLLEDADLVVS
jgi:hypothetical protein